LEDEIASVDDAHDPGARRSRERQGEPRPE
jgi:hypothetical protein